MMGAVRLEPMCLRNRTVLSGVATERISEPTDMTRESEIIKGFIVGSVELRSIVCSGLSSTNVCSNQKCFVTTRMAMSSCSLTGYVQMILIT